MSLDSMLQNFVNKDYDEIKEFAEIALSRLMPPLSEALGEDDAAAALCIFIASSTAADGTLTVKEKQLMKEVMGIEPDKAKEFVLKAHDYDTADKFYDACPSEVQSDLMMLCLCFFAVDERISKEEISLLNRFMD